MNSFILRRIRNIRLLFSHKYKISGISNRNISLLCNNCVGAMVLHDFGLRFNSPTVNLYLTPPDYIRFLCDLETNLTSDIKDVSGVGRPRNFGVSDGVKGVNEASRFDQPTSPHAKKPMTEMDYGQRLLGNDVTVADPKTGATFALFCKSSGTKLLPLFNS